MKTLSTIKYLNKCALGIMALLALGLTGNQAVAGTISGSAHDFSASGFGTDQVCVFCHTPHNADVTVQDAPLWNHEVTTTTFTPYDSPTLQASGGTIGQPDGSSKLCLSCHDGSVAIDSFGGATGAINLTGPAAIGADAESLTNDHPISFVYDAALATADGRLFDPTTETVTIGSGTDTKTGTINEVMLIGTKMQCATCHDVHNNFSVGNKLLRVTVNGSTLCLTCHNK